MPGLHFNKRKTCPTFSAILFTILTWPLNTSHPAQKKTQLCQLLVQVLPLGTLRSDDGSVWMQEFKLSKSSRIWTISRRSRPTTLFVNNCGTLKNPHTIRKEKGTESPVLRPGLYPSQKYLAWLLCSGIIHDHLAAARGAFHMHSADPIELRPL